MLVKSIAWHLLAFLLILQRHHLEPPSDGAATFLRGSSKQRHDADKNENQK